MRTLYLNNRCRIQQKQKFSKTQIRKEILSTDETNQPKKKKKIKKHSKKEIEAAHKERKPSMAH
jgi:hypothetical protein